MHPPPRARHALRVLALAAGLSAAPASCGGSAAPESHRSAPPAPTSTAPPPASTVATTSTTIDPGSLPQTNQLPSAADPAFRARMGALWSAILAGDPSEASPAFFPLSAYIQVKGISDPVHDYQTRLVADFDQDIMTLHSRVSSAASFVTVSVPDAAQWILPGVEYNKGSYWRVYGTRVEYEVSGQAAYFTIASMISWRGQWYVVHLLSIR